MDVQGIIATRRDGKKHSREELEFLAQGAAGGTIPDYQLSAWLMAAYLNPLSEEETAWLTIAIADSGERLDLSGLPKPWLDKHSTGGVGDKTTIVLLPLLAACGLTIVKMSGRGLGITGGTVDKLASIPGFRIDLSPDEMKTQAKRIGVAWTGQTPDLAPADKVLYALRDATATVESIPLITSSILGKKIAGGAEIIVLDVKCGSGAFMKDLKSADALAKMLLAVAKRAGLNVRVALTDMSQPLGCAVGNALEVAEAVEVLDPSRRDQLAPPTKRFRELCLALAAHTLEVAGISASETAGLEKAVSVLDSGAAMAKAREWFAAQGASADLFANLDALPKAPVERTVLFEGVAGWIGKVDAEGVGVAVIELGGGRHAKDDVIDPAVGVVLHTQVGEQIAPGDPLFTVHAASEDKAQAAIEAVRASIMVSNSPVEAPKQIISVY